MLVPVGTVTTVAKGVFWESADTSFVFRIEPKPLFCLCVSVSRNTDLLLLLISRLGKAALGLQLIPSNQLQCIRQIWSITALSLCTWANKLTLLQNMNMSGEGAGMLAWIWIYALIPSICGNTRTWLGSSGLSWQHPHHLNLYDHQPLCSVKLVITINRPAVLKS